MPINNQWRLAYMHSVNVAKHDTLRVMFCHINRWQTLACRTKANVTQIGVYTWQTLGLICHSKLECLWTCEACAAREGAWQLLWATCESARRGLFSMIFERSIDQCAQKSKRHFKDRDQRETAIRMQNAKTVADDDCSKQWSAMLCQTMVNNGWAQRWASWTLLRERRNIFIGTLYECSTRNKRGRSRRSSRSDVQDDNGTEPPRYGLIICFRGTLKKARTILCWWNRN